MEFSVIYSNGVFYAKGNVEPSLISHLVKHGWKHNRMNGLFTHNIKSAALLRDHADDRAEKILNRAFIHHTPWKGALVIPGKLKLLKHQPPSVIYSLSRNRSYLALSPGLGKTIIAAIIAATFGKKCIYVCPPFLTLNTLEEFQKWAPSLNIKILDNVDWVTPDVLIVPDSRITDENVRSYIRAFAPELFIGDEWHRFKTETAQRSKAMFGYSDKRKRVSYTPGILDGANLKKIVYMSGTPMPNRPMELFTTIKKSAGQFIDFVDRNKFGLKYCDGFPVKNEWTGQVYGYDFTGCNEVAFKELMKRMRTKDPRNTKTFMLRLDKKILGLPMLTEEIVILGEDMPRKLKGMNAEMLRLYSPKDLIRLQIKKLMGESTEDEDIHLMTYRRMLGEYKVKPASDFIESILEDTDENILVVAIHKEVIGMLADRLHKHQPLIITGETPVMKRQHIVKEFQNNKKKRIIMGNIDAIGVGFTLTKANRVLLVEFEYDPGSNRQVIDRAHRFGVQHEVTAQYLCFRNSLDRSTIETLLNKEKITKYV